MALHPILDLLLWARWLLAAALVLWLPGHLLAGRHLHGQDAFTRFVMAIATGLLVIPLIGVGYAALRIPFTPATVLPVALLGAVALGRSRTHRAGIAAGGAGIARLDRVGLGIAAASVGLGAVLIALGFGDFVAPPHVHDASNHAYLTLRTVQTESLDPRVLFEGEAGRPAVLYLAGWHAAAGLIARLSGVAPYVSTWMMVLAALVLVPVSLTLLWRCWRLPALAVGFAMPLVVSNQLVPGGVLGWGGFGQILGFFLVPPLVMLVRGLLRRPSWGSGLWIGALLGALVQIHAAEVVVLLVLLFPLAFVLDRGHEPVQGRSHLVAWTAMAVMAVVVCGPMVWALGQAYAASPATSAPGATRSFSDALGRLLAAGGKPVVAEILFVLGLGFAWRERSTRWCAVLALALGLFYLALATRHDPLLLALATPFYQQAPRVLYLQMFVASPLMVLPLLVLRRWTIGRGARRVADGSFGVVLVATVAWSVPGVVTNFRTMHASVPFDEDAYRIATLIPTAVGEHEVIANFWDDGSTWAQHVSGRGFLQPCSWESFDAAGSLRPRVVALLENPWPASTRSLQERGVAHLWVSEDRWPRDVPAESRRDRLEGDARFVRVLSGTDVGLYRIRWDAE